MIAALFGVGVLTGGDEEKREEPEQSVDVERVVRRVEQIRKLKFDEIPPVRTVSPEDAREEGLEQIDAEYPAKRREADQTVLSLLGLIPKDADLRDLAGEIFGEEVAGFYDPREKAMTIVGEGKVDDLTLSHELTHALEDQHFGIGPGESDLDDEASAKQALVEGSATIVMFDYVNPSVERSQVLASLDAVGLFASSGDLPPYLQHALLFPYAAGARFVDAIGTWGPVNRALEDDPPVSTEQVMHPKKYLSGEEPLEVDAGPSPGAGWERASEGTIGEFDTAELIRTVDSPQRAATAAAGWGGGSYELWRRGENRTLKLAWRWDTQRDAAEFVSALLRYIEDRRTGGASVAVQTGDVVRLTIESGD